MEFVFLLLRANVLFANQEKQILKTYRHSTKNVSTLLAATARHVSSANRTNLHLLVVRYMSLL